MGGAVRITGGAGGGLLCFEVAGSESVETVAFDGLVDIGGRGGASFFISLGSCSGVVVWEGSGVTDADWVSQICRNLSKDAIEGDGR